MDQQGLSRFLAPLARRVQLAVFRGVLELVNPSLKMQGVQITLQADEVRDDVEHAEPYGFTSAPHSGAEVFGISVGGNRNAAVVLLVADRRYRLQGLQGGEVALYTDEQDKIVLKRNRIIEITAGTKLRVVTPMLECTGEIRDRCDADGKTMEEMRNIYNTHTHGGVSAGGATTAVPGQSMG